MTAPANIHDYSAQELLDAMIARVPYIQHLGVRFEIHGDELTAILPFADKLIGNPFLPAIHGGVTAAFLEITAIIELTWSQFEHRGGAHGQDRDISALLPRFPKTIDFTIDYLRSGKAQEAYARARVNRSGRRYASVHVEAWQDSRTRLFAQATGHFLMPQSR